MTPEQKPSPRPGASRRRIPVAHLIALGLCVYIAAIWAIGWDRVRDALAGAKLGYVAAAAGLGLVTIWARVLKWRYALGPARQAVGLFFLSKAAGNLSPGRVGELSPLLFRKHRTAQVAAWVIFDRVVEAVVLIAFGLAGLTALGLLSATTVAILAAVLALALAIVSYFAGRNKRLFQRRASTTAAPSSFSGKLLALLTALAHETIVLGKRTPIILATTVFAKTIDIWIALLLFCAFGKSVDFSVMAAAKCAHAVTSVVTTLPDLTGVPYVSAAVFLNEFANVPYNIAAVAFGAEVLALNIVFWSSVGIGLTTLRSRGAKPRDDP